jgi:hypothetical protein
MGAPTLKSQRYPDLAAILVKSGQNSKRRMTESRPKGRAKRTFHAFDNPGFRNRIESAAEFSTAGRYVNESTIPETKLALFLTSVSEFNLLLSALPDDKSGTELTGVIKHWL